MVLPISPKSAETTGAGSGKIVGRPSTVPSVFVNAAFVIGSGEVTLTGPRSRSSRSRELHRRDQIVERDPREPLPPASDPAAQAQSKRRRQPRQHRLEHDPEPEVCDSDARVRSRRGRGLPGLADLGQEVRSVSTVLGEDLILPRAVDPDG